MFAIDYFAPRFFPGRYFAAFGEDARSGAIKVVVNGIERTEYLYYMEQIGWNLIRGARGSCSLPMRVPPGDSFSPQAGELVQIYDPATTRVWSGSIDSIDVRWIGDAGWKVVTITGVTLEQLVDTAEVDKIKYAVGASPATPVKAGRIAADILSRAGVSIALGTVDDGPDIESIEVTNVKQALDTLALQANFVWYIDPIDEKFYFHAPTARTAAWTMESQDVLWETLRWKQNRADFRDTQIIQLPAVALKPITASFAGGATTFLLPVVPEFLVSVSINPTGASGRTVDWTAGSQNVTITPAPPASSTVVITFMDGGTRVLSSAGAPGLGNQTRRYTLTRSFTEAGGLQEANAMLARYSMLPSQLVGSTDRYGMQIARLQTINVDAPIGADAIVNGDWIVKELEAAIVPGLDMQKEPFGHFRYTYHLINSQGNAIFPGDGVTTDFVLPEIPSAVSTQIVNAFGPVPTVDWSVGTAHIIASGPLPVGATLIVTYTGANSPDVPTFMNLWEDMTRVGEATPLPLSINPTPGEGTGGSTPDRGPYPFTRTLTLRKTAVRDDCAPHTTVYHDGTAYRLLAVLRKTISADLTVRINKTDSSSMSPLVPVELLTVTIPSGTAVNDVLEFSLATGSPAVLGQFYDKEVLTADILESDGSSDADGVAQFTVEWQLT